jgi:hypothetical protein
MTMIQDLVSLFCAFLVVHVLADFPLQRDILAKQKIRKDAKTKTDWLMALTAHSVIHGGWLVTGSLAFGMVEFFLRWVIDLAKGEGVYGVLTDQSLHLLCELTYVLVIFYGDVI